MEKELTQRERPIVSEIPSRTSRQTSRTKIGEESGLKRGHCGI